MRMAERMKQRQRGPGLRRLILWSTNAIISSLLSSVWSVKRSLLKIPVPSLYEPCGYIIKKKVAISSICAASYARMTSPPGNNVMTPIVRDTICVIYVFNIVPTSSSKHPTKPRIKTPSTNCCLVPEDIIPSFIYSRTIRLSRKALLWLAISRE